MHSSYFIYVTRTDARVSTRKIQLKDDGGKRRRSHEGWESITKEAIGRMEMLLGGRIFKGEMMNET